MDPQSAETEERFSGTEERLSELQTQIDGLSATLKQWQQRQDDAQPMDQMIAKLTEQCAAILDRPTTTDERSAGAVAEIEEKLASWAAVETRLHEEARDRIRGIEAAIGQEWQTIKRMHEEPVKQLAEQAATLGETCVNAANLALQGFERAEARFAALEQELEGRLNDLARDVHAAVAGLQDTGHLPLPGGVSPFPLESVMRIHNDLREEDGTDHAQLSPHEWRQVPLLPESTAFNERLESLERALVEARTTADRSSRTRQTAYAAVGLLAAALMGLGAFSLRQRGLESRLTDATARAEAAEQQAQTATVAAEQRIVATRQEADRQVAEAQQSARQAQTISSVLVAPDLRRFDLIGGPRAPRAYAQALVSRTRGLVLSASRLAPPPRGRAYQAWIWTNYGPVSLGLLSPDTAGHVTLVTEVPPNVPRPITGATVTLERATGRRWPTGPTVLGRSE